MLYRAKAPLRVSFAGGGTDVNPYSDIYGGCILNACINMYAYATIEPRNDDKIVLNSADRGEYLELEMKDFLEINGKLDILKSVYNRIVKNFTKESFAFTLTTYVDAPAGSGLGSSSTLVVAILKAFCEWKNIPLGEYDLAYLAWVIERIDLDMAGGKQDQYAAAFGGFNFMEFNDNKIIVNPLRIKQEFINELEFNVLLYYTGTSRLSSNIIKSQSENVENCVSETMEAMHKLKEQSILMKEALLKGKIDEMGELLNFGWKYKKQLSVDISNPMIDEIYKTALEEGATGGKISGAGGGGFFMFYCPENTRYNVINSLQKFGGEFRRFRFTNIGAQSWSINNIPNKVLQESI